MKSPRDLAGLSTPIRIGPWLTQSLSASRPEGETLELSRTLLLVLARWGRGIEELQNRTVDATYLRRRPVGGRRATALPERKVLLSRGPSESDAVPTPSTIRAMRGKRAEGRMG